MSRSRCLLARSKLSDFEEWLRTQGWIRREPKGDYEILRMRLPGQPVPLIVWTRGDDESVHLTLQGVSQIWFRRWRNSQQQPTP